MIRYRFKTKEEFIEEFGIHWKDRVNWNNKTGMDYLLGTQIPYNEDELDSNGLFYIKNTNEKYLYCRWAISGKMIKQINVINYNDKKVLVYD